MRVYILNHYVGGIPFEGHTIGVYTTKEQAREEFKKSFATFGYSENDERIEQEHTEELELLSEHEGLNVISSWYIDDDSSDFWGGCEIQVIEINN